MFGIDDKDLLKNLQRSAAKKALQIAVSADYLSHKASKTFDLNLKSFDFNRNLTATNHNVEKSLQGKQQESLAKSLEKEQKDGDKFTEGVDSINSI